MTLVQCHLIIQVPICQKHSGGLTSAPDSFMTNQAFSACSQKHKASISTVSCPSAGLMEMWWCTTTWSERMLYCRVTTHKFIMPMTGSKHSTSENWSSLSAVLSNETRRLYRISTLSSIFTGLFPRRANTVYWVPRPIRTGSQPPLQPLQSEYASISFMIKKKCTTIFKQSPWLIFLKDAI